ncbi:hypothetical protein M422DRAFT_268344 [Sphaerobolus stellatus SS14]|uniref:DUF6533 domain-containing protein n=1 Tax=Sphaerobolus stellatus (strain SS14) TaxID=990650 RepID=A0A0C9TKC2_SPHS4|nr:hypothetical protein M422DRAFT_268344 [Sphaerobolus stellatus SS14]
MSAAELEILKTLVEGVTTTKYSSLAAFVFLLYDHGITFEEEVFLVWGRDWTYGKILFMFNRYFGLLSLVADVTVLFTPSLTDKVMVSIICEKYLRWEILSSIVALVTAGAILASRVHAVYHRNWRVTGVIVFALLGATLSSFIIDYVNIPDTAALPFGLTGCYLFNLPKHYKYTWIPPLICETAQCGFMLYKAWRLYIEKSDSPLLTIIIRDSFLYFMTVFSVLLVNCLVWAAAPQSLAEVAVGWLVAIPCTIGSRLLLNMRKRYLKEQTVESSVELQRTGTNLSFTPLEIPRWPHPDRKRSQLLVFTVDEFTISDSE